MVEATPYVEALASSLAEDEGASLSLGTAQCIAEAVVAQIDLQTLNADGVTPQALGQASDLSGFDAVREDADAALPDALAECNLGDDTLKTIADAFGSSVETIECMRASIDDRELGELYASTFLSDGDGERLGESYGAGLIGGLPDQCAQTVAISLLLEGGAVTQAQAACLEQELSGGLARLMIGPDGSGPEAQAGVEDLIAACP